VLSSRCGGHGDLARFACLRSPPLAPPPMVSRNRGDGQRFHPLVRHRLLGYNAPGEVRDPPPRPAPAGQQRRGPTSLLHFGRMIRADLTAADQRQWLIASSIGGCPVASIADPAEHRNHVSLRVAVRPPQGRTGLQVKTEGTVGTTVASLALFAASGSAFLTRLLIAAPRSVPATGRA
jgi:hypothetical protein